MDLGTLFQESIEKLKDISKTDICIMDLRGKVIAKTFNDIISINLNIMTFINLPIKMQILNGYEYFKISNFGVVKYILIIQKIDDSVVGNIIKFHIQTVLDNYMKNFDKDNFIKSIVINDTLPVDVYEKAEILHIESKAKRIVYIVQVNNIEKVNVIETIRTFFIDRVTDFITTIDEENIIIIKEINNKYESNELKKVAESISDLLNTNGIKDSYVAYGTIINNLIEIQKSYREAKVALEIGKIFYKNNKIMEYNALGIGRLIYQLPIEFCQIFISEIFGDRTPDDFDEETLSTINKFFENNLNVSETSRQLYVHRNTLVYRLDKLQKITGLDLRTFDDAIIFKIASMVVKYMKYKEV